MVSMKKIGIGLSLLAGSSFVQIKAMEPMVNVSVGEDALNLLEKELGAELIGLSKHSEMAVIRMPESELPRLSALMHEIFHRCGGFMIESDFVSAELDWQYARLNAFKSDENLYKIDQQDLVRMFMRSVDESQIKSSIETLSGFRNRYYRSEHGVNSQVWLKNKWQSIAQDQESIQVDLFNHGAWSQPSVVLTWAGSEAPDEVIVLGGHGDSIAGWFPGNQVHAPGADDNASGISTITEVLRVLIEGGFQPKRTIKLMSYAAEEVGLRGSDEIAKLYQHQGVKVKGVMQLDMTNFDGGNWDIVLITDNTNQEQNEFVGRLIDTYLPDLRWTTDQCGYACSDHASWHRQRYPVSFPFEAAFNEYNDAIHTSSDTLAQSDHHAEHAVPFAKLATAFITEMSQP